MSIPGIRSNRGDIYQTLIAFDWVLTVLNDPEYLWLEIDSISYQVDDIVVGKSDGTIICCQCKKNEPSSKAWSIASLEDELDKAAIDLIKIPQCCIRFYSRNNFGAIEKLREFSTNFSDEVDYLANLTVEHIKTDGDLAAAITTKTSSLSTFEFLKRSTFEVTSDYDRLEAILLERLQRLASNPEAAFNALWASIDKLGGRVEDNSTSATHQHRLTKNSLQAIIRHAGSILTPEVSIDDVSFSFASTSAIGRAWQRDISGQIIPASVVEHMLTAINSKHRSILLTGLPGSGKTCAMLTLQERLEEHAQTQNDLIPLFIQSREFADLTTSSERKAQGFADQWVEQAARLADTAHVVVVIDSLDVLSIARDHSVLSYFLAQIDRLLLVPNVTIVTACRDFDRRYDRRIASREWDSEFECSPLAWETEITPLLSSLSIDTTNIDDVTRELICNPRELALFVELAQREGSFNVVTSQALAQRYLDTIVLADAMLGGAAMQAIEAIAKDMLNTRSLSVPQQHFRSSQDVLRQLLSLNVLQKTYDGKLTFGHQTLLDVLVISAAIRQGESLNQFIHDLPPVPFVRPSIRSFVSQLATGARQEFRKQIRTVLTGSAPFHIRRLVAESFAEQLPLDDDWPMIRKLRDDHREVFQVIYLEAKSIKWHHFWLTHLVPALLEMRDQDGLITHANHITLWANDDATSVIKFWIDSLALEWLDIDRIIDPISYSLSKFESNNLHLLAPLLKRLIDRPYKEHSTLGHTIARCIKEEHINDELLWQYITKDINEHSLMGYHLGDKLHCAPHEFGNTKEEFLKNRMQESTILLDLALQAIEQWSDIQSVRHGIPRPDYSFGFLDQTSYEETHTKHDHQHINSDRVLFRAVESSILNHADNNTDWWKSHQERIAFSHEGSFCYFAIIAATQNPQQNQELIGKILCDDKLLEFYLTYELGNLIRESFIYLDSAIQDTVTETILKIGVHEEELTRRFTSKIGYIKSIPCHLRSRDAQKILSEFESAHGQFMPQPHIRAWSGAVTAPFTYEEFLNASDNGVIRLLNHYTQYKRERDEFLDGGAREVGWQLRIAASCHPSRFLTILSTYWVDIADDFIDDIMDGVSNYIARKYGNLNSNEKWTPIEEPDAPTLASKILDELEKHSPHWRLNRSAANAIEYISLVIDNTNDAARLVFLAIGFANHLEKSIFREDDTDLLNDGINMMTGKVAEGLMILITNLHENKLLLPDLLEPTLRQFSSNQQPAVRAVILRRLPYLQNLNSKLGWELFHRTICGTEGLWRFAEQCMYYAYHDDFDRVKPLLDDIILHDHKAGMETWGRISALASMTGHIDFNDLLTQLNKLENSDAWEGASTVWSNHSNNREHPEQCLSGIEAGLNSDNQHAIVVARQARNIFHNSSPPILVPESVIQACLVALENDTDNNQRGIYDFGDWMNAVSQRNPQLALSAAEHYLDYVKRTKDYFYDHEDQMVQAMTRLFSEAEENEDTDNGAMLKRVVSVQDILLSLGAGSIKDWLKAAERQ